MNELARKKVILTDADRFPLGSELLEQLSEHGIELAGVNYGNSEAELIEACRDADGVIVFGAKITDKVIEQMSRCRIIARCGTGFDNIHVEAARNKGITVTYVPDYCVEEVSDHTVSLLLDCWRRTTYSSQRVKLGFWEPYHNIGVMRRVSSQTVGFLGFGRIAQAVARKLQGFGAQLLAYDPYIAAEAAEQYGVTQVEQEALLSRSDVLILLMPLTSETRHIINAGTLAQMKQGAIIVNTSRGGLVEEGALVQALQSGKLAAVGLDVLEHEPPLPGHPLLQLPQAIITPHSAAFSEEALWEVEARAVQEIIRNFRGLSPMMPVPVSRLICRKEIDTECR